MTDEQFLAQLDRDEKAAKNQLDLGNALERLYKNRDFKALIVDGFLKDEAVRLVHLRADENMRKPEIQEAIDNQITAIGVFHQFLLAVQAKAAVAAKQVKQIEDSRTDFSANAAPSEG